MKKQLFLFLFLLAGTAAQAQVPGYQGQRFSVGCNASSFLFFDGVDGLFDDFPFSMRLSYKTEFNVNYTLSRKVTAGFSMYYGKQQYRMNPPNSNFETVEDRIPCHVMMYEFNLKFFRKNFVAPAGLYNQFGLAIVKYGLSTPDNELEVAHSAGSTVYTLEGPTSDLSGYKLSYHLGKTTPVGHHLYINTAIGVNFFRGGDLTKIRYADERTFIQAGLNKNIRRHNFAEIKIGLGWFAF